MAKIYNKKREFELETGVGNDDWRIAVFNGRVEYGYTTIGALLREWADVMPYDKVNIVEIKDDNYNQE